MRSLLDTLNSQELAVLKLRNIYEDFGYKKFKVSRFEEYSYYLENRNFLFTKNIATFTDLDGRLMALKPDVTLSAVRNSKASAENPEKLYYIETVCRENQSYPSYQELSQTGVEFLGSVDLYTTMEMITLAAKSLEVFGGEYVLVVGNMDFVLDYFNSLGLNPDRTEKLLPYFTAKSAHELRKAASGFGIKDEDYSKLCDLSLLHGEFPEILIKAREFASTPVMQSVVAEMEAVYDAACAAGIAKNLRLDFAQLNDISYYNGVIFTGYLQGNPRVILSGGRYDRMMNKIGKKTGAIGFAVYLDEVPVSSEREYDADVFIFYEDDMLAGDLLKEVSRLTGEGLSVFVGRAPRKDIRHRRLYRFDSNGLGEVKC